MGHPDPLRVCHRHVLSAGSGIIQLGLPGLALVAGAAVPTIGWISLPSIAVIFIYTLAAWTIFVFERARVREVAEAIAAIYVISLILLAQRA